MKIPFRQGIVRHQTNNLNQDFLVISNGVIDLLVTNEHTIIHFAHLTSNYIYREPRSVLAAWSGPFVGGTDYWLYWDLDQTTGIRTFGHTDIEPSFGATEPVAPLTDQMWFNTVLDTMTRYNGVNFEPVIRVVAAKFESASIIQAWNGGTTFDGTQLADYTPNDAGSLLFDRTDIPLTRGDGSFITTIDGFSSGIGSSSIIRVEALDFDAESAANIAAYTIVYLSDFDTILPGNPSLIANAIMGIIEEDVTPGQRVNIVTSGVIRNMAWNWASPNSMLYIDGAGQLTDIIQPGMHPLGFTISPTSIELKTAGITEVSVVGGPSGADGVVTGGFINGSNQLILTRSESLADVTVDVSSLKDGVITSGITQNTGTPELVLTDSNSNEITINLTNSGFGSGGGGSSYEITDADNDTKVYVDDSGSNDEDAVVVGLGLPPFLEYHFSAELSFTLEPLYFNGFVFGLSMPDMIAGQSGDGPTIEMRAGRGRGNGFAGGPIEITAGEGNQDSIGGQVIISGGNGVNGTGTGGQAIIRGGGSEDGIGGSATVIAGGSDTSNGGNVNITGGASNSASGGDIVITAGDATTNSGTISLTQAAGTTGGNIEIVSGSDSNRPMELRFLTPGGFGGYTGFSAPPNPFAFPDKTTYHLPVQNGTTGQVLTTTTTSGFGEGVAPLSWTTPDTAMKTNISHIAITSSGGDTINVDPTILWTMINRVSVGDTTIVIDPISAAFDSEVVTFTIEINNSATGNVIWPANILGDTTLDVGMINIFTLSRRPAFILPSPDIPEAFYIVKIPMNSPAT